MGKNNSCCFFGHRKINVSEELINSLNEVIEQLITKEKVEVFLFGSKSEFNTLCLNVVNKLKEKYSHIKRIYVRAEYPYINDDYRAYLLESYDDTYYPERIICAGRAVYVERNYEMIDKSSFCVIYFNENYMPPKGKSGTKLAYDYALKKPIKVVNVYK